jgi:hypothetical protein
VLPRLPAVVRFSEDALHSRHVTAQGLAHDLHRMCANGVVHADQFLVVDGAVAAMPRPITSVSISAMKSASSGRQAWSKR